ncbi:hypothetical protein KFL_000630280 [Klebsormidium nitens]|uniref:Uncharacterized protein n=1 Tax=Klebsormidium nitens TaxID=105231 RepID=A0A1Y1HWE9_KLENI|nr:hypothetical protein KFL_000630280 [Klebsormidium nitens]|eukprot:GAQ80826.1 hypothetical protein KFL_000630280 [Klebsormidium nitens]
MAVSDMHFERRGGVVQLRIREAPPEAWGTVRPNAVFQKGATYRAISKRRSGIAVKEKMVPVLAKKLSTVAEEGEAPEHTVEEDGLVDEAVRQLADALT